MIDKDPRAPLNRAKRAAPPHYGWRIIWGTMDPFDAVPDANVIKNRADFTAQKTGDFISIADPNNQRMVDIAVNEITRRDGSVVQAACRDV